MGYLQLKNINNPIEEDSERKLLEQITINERSLVAWYEIDTKSISLMLFHYDEQPNPLSKLSPYTTWGYLTRSEEKMMSEKEAAEVVSLYLKDIKEENFWWEEN